MQFLLMIRKANSNIFYELLMNKQMNTKNLQQHLIISCVSPKEAISGHKFRKT